MKRILAVSLTLAMALNIAPVGALAASDSDAASIQAVAETEESPSSALDEETARAIASDPFLQRADSAPVEQQQAEVENSTSEGYTDRITNLTLDGQTATVEVELDGTADLVVAVYTDSDAEEMVASGTAEVTGSGTKQVTITGDIPAAYTVKAYLLDTTEHAPLSEAQEYTGTEPDKPTPDPKPDPDPDPDTPSGTTKSGICGDDLTWTLEPDGTMTITGTGDMYDYGTGMFGDTGRAPWYQDLSEKNEIKKLQLDEGITHIGSYAFMGGKFETLTIPDSVVTIGDGAFSGCENLKNVTMGDNVTDIGMMAFLSCKEMTSIHLSEALKTISNMAFRDCEKLESVILPSGLEELDMWAFQNCKSLTEITIPGSVVEIGGTYGMAGGGLGAYVFQGCEKLETVTIQRGIKELYDIFKDCTALREISLPDTIEVIGQDAFATCTALTNVTYAGTEEQWNAINIKSGNDPLLNAQRTYQEGEKETTGTCGQNLTWTLNEDDILTIHGTGAMNDFTEVVPWDTDKVQKVVVEDGATNIGAYAFFACPNLTEVQLPDSVTAIHEGAFAECPKLAEIQLSGNLTYLGASAFRNDVGLLSIDLPDKLVTLGARAFEGCTHLQNEIVIPDGVTEISKALFYGCYKIPSIQLPDTVENIGAYAFCKCEEIEQINIPESVVSIGEDAFRQCYGLKKVVLPDGVTSIEKNTFDWCYNLSEVVLPKNLTTIGDSAFDNTAITAMELPDSVTSIGDSAFQYTKLKGTFKIPAGVTEIGTSIFKDCHDLTEVVLPEGITKIGSYAFYNTGITDIVIPDGVKKIDIYTFYGADLKSITIPASVTSISTSAFDGCWDLKDVYYKGTKTQWNAIVMSSGNKLREAIIHCTDGDIVPDAENSITHGTTTTKDSKFAATFSDVKANKDYVVIVSRSGSDPLSADNLLYIDQITAQADGELAVPFVTTATTGEMQYIVACARDDSNPDQPDNPDQPSDPGDTPASDGGNITGAVILVGGIVAVAAVAGIVLAMPVDVQGTVKQADQPVVNATVQVMQGDNVTAQTTTNADGWFAVKVRRGNYTLRVTWTDAEGNPVTRTVDFKAPDKNLNIAA